MNSYLVHLKEKKFEKSLVKTIQEGIEKEKKEAIEKKIKENKALINAIKENDIKIKKRKNKKKNKKKKMSKWAKKDIKCK